MHVMSISLHYGGFPVDGVLLETSVPSCRDLRLFWVALFRYHGGLEYSLMPRGSFCLLYACNDQCNVELPDVHNADTCQIRVVFRHFIPHFFTVLFIMSVLISPNLNNLIKFTVLL